MPEDIKQKQPALVYDPARLKRVLVLVKSQIIPGNYHKEGYRLLRGIELLFHEHTEFSRLHSELFQELNHALVLLKFFCLNRLNEKELLDLIQNHFVDLFEIQGYDLENKFKQKLLTMLYFIDQDELKEKVKRVLLLNKQHITKGRPVFHAIEQPPTVANWLKDFTSETAGSKDTLAFFEYLENSKNTRYLSDEDRERLHSLLKFYTSLSYSSFTIEGTPLSFTYVDENGHLMSFKDGELEDISSDKDVKKIVDDLKEKGLISDASPAQEEMDGSGMRPYDATGDPALQAERGDAFGVRGYEDARARYAPPKPPESAPSFADEISGEAVIETAKSLIEQTLGEFDPLVKHLADAVRLSETLEAVSVLYVMNKLGFLPRLLKDETEIRAMYTDYLKQGGRKELLRNFKLMPGSQDHIKRCITFLFVLRLQIPRKDAEEIIRTVIGV